MAMAMRKATGDERKLELALLKVIARRKGL